MNAPTALAGGVFQSTGAGDENTELRRLVDDIGRRSLDARPGRHDRPRRFDDALWCDLEQTGLARLTSTPDVDAGPAELAIVLRGLARHAGAVPIAETDLLAAWLATTAELQLPLSGPLTVALCDAEVADGRICGTAHEVPWTRTAAAIVLAANTSDALHVASVAPAELEISAGHNLAGEPRDRVGFALPAERFCRLDTAVYDELVRRAAWARCVQIIGALDATAELSVEHTSERVQFGRPLSKFQSVQHALAAMAGEIERARAAVTLAVAAACDHGFGTAQSDYAVTVAKVVAGRVVDPVTTIAHQLHGAIGVTIEHRLWLATTAAQSWITEYGSTAHHARRLGEIALSAENPWDVVIGNDLAGWR
ncbi:acyl-CoA dehydrogenase family protein [Mycobacterium branderi]|uniref:Acyl-CoA dehydrogenase n=1 Tax=Mycobacterium branderi TaxID=43348 RepID=A0A7I7WFE9_9MYCO|nr:acyl-CoA dehydrogenase family protein [Mycobacterium branderi]MCV7231765.1 acyl-CoA dehydrogenase [Mycobacterium branderi]ORA40273.1 acyl-CoA dehydrogenase [Mycobacterium branderi]BBZ15582.1 acyl-CoA dehydrogenase [Mycobacterium branderi]